MNKKHITIAIIAIFLFSTIALNVSAGIFDNLFDNMNEFFEGGWERYDALLSFFLIFILLFSGAYIGLRKAFVGDDKTKSRPAIGIALAFAGISAVGIVSGFGFRIGEYGYVALGFFLLMLVFIIYSVLLKLGMEKHKLLAFLIALIIVAIIVLFTAGLLDARGIRLGGLGLGSGRGRGLGISGITTPDWLRDLFTRKDRVREPPKAPVGPAQGQVEGNSVFWNGAWRGPEYVRPQDGREWNGKEWVCPEGTKWDEEQEKCAPSDEEQPGEETAGDEPGGGGRFPWGWVGGGGGIFLIAIIVYIMYVSRKKKPEEPPGEEKPEVEAPEKKVTVEEKINKLHEAIDNLKKQKEAVLKSINKELKKEKKNTAKLLGDIQDFDKWFKKKGKETAWLADTSKHAEVLEKLKSEREALIALLRDEQVLERDLLVLLRLEKELERIYGQLQQVENLDPNLKTKLPIEMQKMAQIIRTIEDGIKKLSPHLKEEELTEQRLKDLVAIENVEQRTKPTWIKYKETNEEKIEQLITQDKETLNSLKKQITEEISVLEKISKILKGEVEELEDKKEETEEKKEASKKLIEEAEELEKEPNNYEEALDKLKEAKKLDPDNEEVKRKKAELEDKKRRRDEFKNEIAPKLRQLNEELNKIT